MGQRAYLNDRVTPEPAHRNPSHEDVPPHWDTPSPAEGPNVVLVVLDDTGFADLGCYGSLISTPTVDRLAEGGVLYNNFHVTPLCSPTRAALLTGRNHHTVGMSFLSDIDTGYSNARGRVTRDADMLPEVLRDAGYATMGVGKWHLTPKGSIGAAGPFDDWPLARGFDRFYGFQSGVADHWHPELIRDNHTVMPPDKNGYHLSSDLIDQALVYVKDHLSLQVASALLPVRRVRCHTRPHQVPVRYIEPYVDVFAKGWDETRDQVLERQMESGVVPPGTTLTARNEGVRPWDELSEVEQLVATRLQATYAGFLEHTDEQPGRLIVFLDEAGILDNTLVMVLSDNGASAEGGELGTLNVYARRGDSAEEKASGLHKLGKPTSTSHYGWGWAMASNTPFRRYKQFVDGGGVNAPLVIHWPAARKASPGIRGQFVHAIDIMPTILDATSLEAPSHRYGRKQLPIAGASILETLGNPDASDTSRRQYFEMFGQRALWSDGWKAIADHTTGEPYEQDIWRLYDLRTDLSEARDLAAEHPDRLERLQREWWEEAERYGVLPLDDRPMGELLDLASNQPIRELRLWAEQSPITWDLIPRSASQVIQAVLDIRSTDANGVILSRGGESGGMALFLLEGTVVFEHNILGEPHRLITPFRVGPATVIVTADIDLLNDGARSRETTQ